MLIHIEKTASKPLFNREKAAVFTHILSRFEASVMICDRNRSINAKSLLGLLSLGRTDDHRVEFTIDGPDEQEALEAIKAFFAKE